MALVPAAVIALSDARSLGYDPIELLWLGVLLVAGGQIGVVTWLLWSIVGACGVAATALALQAGAQRATPKVVKEQEPRYVARASRARRPALWR
jgi:hypothetical protein